MAVSRWLAWYRLATFIKIRMHPQVQHLLTKPKHEQRSQAWLEQRKTCAVTASEVAGVLDIKPFSTYSAYGGHPRQEVLLRKAFPNDPRYKFAGNSACDHGTKHEPDAIAKYEEATGRKVLEFGFIVHEEIPWLGASPDGITEDGILIEAKCPVSRKLEYGEDGQAICPEHYRPQARPTTL